MPLACLCVPQCVVADDAPAAPAATFRAVTCQQAFADHLQGICTNDRDAIYWSFTDALVKTDLAGHVQIQKSVPSHHGDLCLHDGRIYVAVNLGEFNRPTGADSWVYVYDAELNELARHELPELVHGAGGIAYHDGKFIVVGGLPSGVKENYLYEYDESLRFRRRHVLESGPTFLGIQTAAFADDHWWFGCYGAGGVLLKVDPAWQLVGKSKFDAALGLTGLPDGRFLVARGQRDRDRRHTAQLLLAKPDGNSGLELLDSQAGEPGK